MKFLKSLFIVFSIVLISCSGKKTNPKTASFSVSGMTCAIGCAKTIENKLSNTEGVQKSEVNFDKKMVSLNYDSSVLNENKITKIVEEIGDGKTYKVSNFK